MPQRIQLSRARGWRMPANSVKVDRSTPFGNPFALSKGSMSGGGERREGYFVGDTIKLFDTREEAQRVSVAAFEAWMHQWPQHQLLAAARHALRGKNLACWCKLPNSGEPDLCHAAVLLRISNDEPKEPGA